MTRKTSKLNPRMDEEGAIRGQNDALSILQSSRRQTGTDFMACHFISTTTATIISLMITGHPKKSVS